MPGCSTDYNWTCHFKFTVSIMNGGIQWCLTRLVEQREATDNFSIKKGKFVNTEKANVEGALSCDCG